MIEYENLARLNEPFLADYKKRFQDVLESGWFILGKQVEEFEKSFAAYCGTTHCAGVASGLDALTLSLKALQFEAGQEVIVPSNTYIATILSIYQAGLKPVLVEPDIKTYNLDPSKLEAAITSKTVAVMPVHLYGKCAPMKQITSICDRKGLKIIEDAAQAHGASIDGQKAGTFGDLGAFSFYPTKNLGALGDGGCITTSSDDLLSYIRTLRNYGSRVKYVNEMIGFNSRLDELQAAFLRVKLEKLEEINAHKRKLASVYQANLKNDFIKPVIEKGYHDIYHIYAVRHPERDRLREHLSGKGIKTEVHYPIPPHKQAAMKGLLDHHDFPIADEIHRSIVSLPISYFHTSDDILQVVEVMNQF